MEDNQKLRDAVRQALGLGTGVLAALAAPVVVAQDQSQATANAQEEMIVTGSRIKRADLSSASPITVVNRDDMLATGITDVGKLVQRLPAMSGSPIGTTTNNGGDGAVEIDLRGMGVDRTLTLINGKRMVDGGDYQTIPAAMVERIEILKDGASAVYGADAVAGVVNIITRKDFEGVEVSAQQADFFDMDDGSQQTASLLFGKVFDGGNFVFGAEYVNQDEAFQSDAPWGFFQDSFYIYPEGCENQLTAPYTGAPSGGCYPLGSSRIPEARLGSAELTQQFNDPAKTDPRLFDWFNGKLDNDPLFDPAFGVPTFNNPSFINPGTGLVADDGRLYNYAPVNYIQTPYERTNFFAEGNFELTENIRFNTEVRANFRESSQELAPMPFDSRSGFDPAHQGSWAQIDPLTGLPLREIAQVNAAGDTVFVYTADQNIGQAVAPIAYNGISEDNFYNTLGFPVRDARRRMVETTRRFDQSITQFQVVMGLEGEIRDIDWNIYYNRGHRTRTDIDSGQFSGARLNNALGPSADLDGDGIPECYRDITDANTLIDGCVPLNFFGGEGTVTQDMIDYVGVSLTDTRETRQDIVNLSFSGAAFKLPGGELGWAAGYNYWGQSFNYNPDSGKTTDSVTGSTGAATDGALYSNSLFAEVLAPVFDNGTQSVDLKGGLRWDDYNRFDSETTWQLGVEVRAIESLKLRATAGTVFRAPTIDDLFEGQLDDAPTFSDPCAVAVGLLPAGCAQVAVQADTQVKAKVGGNPDLQAETGDTWTVGLVWTPEFFGGHQSLTVDYWSIDIEDGISSLGVQFILDDCHINLNAASCALISRRPGDFSVEQIIDGNLNVADQGAQGIDTEFNTNFDSAVGQWDASIMWAHLLERTKTPFAGDPEIDLSGRYTDPTAEDGGAYAEDKINYSLQWSWKGLSVAYLGEFISSLDADTFCNCGAGNRPDGTYIQSIDSFLYHDIVVNYETDFSGAGMTTFTAGITNFTDEEPPFIDTGFNATTDPSTYRLFGIGYYVRLTHHFE